MRILTANLRDARANDGDNAWVHRMPLCVSLLLQADADVICCQEVRAQQRQDLCHWLTGYHSFGVAESRHDDSTPDLVFYRPDRWRLLEHGGCWLSTTPALAGSGSWGSRYPRMMNWIRLQARTGGTPWCIANTHLEDDAPDTALQQLDVVLQHLPNHPDDLRVLTGDLNNDTDSPVLHCLREHRWRDSWQAAHPDTTPGRTFHAFDGERCQQLPDGQIDWILVQDRVQVLAAEIIRDSLNGLYPSDHFFLHATLKEDTT